MVSLANKSEFGWATVNELLNLSLRNIFMQLKELRILLLGRSFVDDITNYGTHSIKSGAASNPACIGVFLVIF